MVRRGRSKDGVNKSQLIRDTFAKLGRRARPRDVIEVLAKDGIHVSRALVTNVLNRDLQSKQRGRVAGTRRRNSMQATLSVSELLTAKKLVEESGSVDAARQVLDAYSRLV